MKNRIKLIFFIILPFLFYSAVKTVAFGQHVSVSASLDSTLMVIGGQMNFQLEVVQPANLEVIIPVFSDTITKNIEVVRFSKPDTIRNGDILSISRLYTITSFDSGLHYIPPVEVEYLVGEMFEKQASRSLGLLVVNPFVEVDPQKGFFDIKQPLNLPFSLLELVKYIKWILLFLLVAAILIIGIYWWVKKRNPIKEIFFVEKPKEPPHITALRELDRIKNEKLWQKGQIKQYQSQLTDVMRKYMEGRFNFPAMELSTTEILQTLKNIDLSDEKLKPWTSKILETADLAKFAKYEPLADENENSLNGAYFLVNQTTKPEETENELVDKENIQKSNN